RRTRLGPEFISRNQVESAQRESSLHRQWISAEPAPGPQSQIQPVVRAESVIATEVERQPGVVITVGGDRISHGGRERDRRDVVAGAPFGSAPYPPAPRSR